MVPLGELTETVEKWNPRNAPSLTFRYIDLSTVDSTSKTISEVPEVIGSEAPSRARQVIQLNDVLVSTVRPYLNAVAVVPGHLDDSIASTGFSVLRASSTSLSHRYLFHWVRTHQFIDEMTRKSTGASYPAVSDRIVKESLIPLPPIDEQRSIAAVLDHADALREKRKEQLAHLDTLAQSIFHDMFGDPDEGEVDEVELGQVLGHIESGSSPKCEPRPADSDEWGVLKLGAVTYGTYRPDENKAYLAPVGNLARYEVRRGDILMTRKNTRELVGAVSVAHETPPRLLLPDLIFRLSFNRSRVHATYFQTLMMSPRMRARVRELSSGSAASMPNISMARLKKLRIPLPAMTRQLEFTDRLALLDPQRRLMEQSVTQCDELFASLQSRAFSGLL